MTLDTLLALARLKELRALEHVRGAILANGTDPDWMYALVALDVRLNELHAWLAQDDPAVLRRCVELLDGNAAAPAVSEAPVGLAERIH